MQGRRRTQEDRELVHESMDTHPEMSLFGVFDGHNGDECAEFVSKTIEHELIHRMDDKGRIAPAFLTDAFTHTDDAFLQHTADVGCEAGCTASIVLLNRRRNTVVAANVGDARCVLGRNGRAIALSRDHKPDMPMETRRIERFGHAVVDKRYVTKTPVDCCW
jgi:protein phosphatase 1L